MPEPALFLICALQPGQKAPGMVLGSFDARGPTRPRVLKMARAAHRNAVEKAFADPKAWLYGRDSTKQGDYVKALSAIVKDAPNKKVPPGIYAEYGFMELNAGHTESALSLFAKEKQAWPESSAFMDRVSNGVKGGNDAGNATPSQKTTPVS